MWTRADLKEKGKSTFLRNFWLCVLVALILTIATGATSGNSNHTNSNNQNSHRSVFQWEQNHHDYYEDEIIQNRGVGSNYVEAVTGNLTINIGPFSWIYNRIMSGLGTVLIAITFVSAILISILVVNPLKVGCYRFFYENLFDKAALSEIGFVFKNGWMNTGLTLFIRDIKIMLWTLLFIVPGIIKTYEYRMVPYLLAENPDMSREEVFRRSRLLMDGQKLNAFILDLSFIGWHFLGAITLGLVEIFWAKPYHESTNAALYGTLRDSSWQ